MTDRTVEGRPVTAGEYHGTGELEHAPGCPGPRVVRHDGTRRAQLTCTACGRWVTVLRRNEWRG